MRKIMIILLVITAFGITSAAGSDQYNIDRDALESWSAKFRNWHYYGTLVIPPSPNDGLNFQLTDCPLIYRIDDNKWYMWYLGYDGRGYQTAVAESNDLVNWKPKQLVMSFGKPGAFDYGGVTFGGALFESYDLDKIGKLKKFKGKYRVLYGCYLRQGGYELGPGAQGAAWSDDGITWHRQSEDKAVLSIEGASDWEKETIYQPWLVEHDGKFWNFYNAYGSGGGQIGVAISNDFVTWERYAENPILRTGSAGSYDSGYCSDPKVFRDGDHWVMIYFGVGKGGEHIMAAFSRDLLHWTAHPEPLYKAGGHPTGLDSHAAHKITLIYNPKKDTYYMFYCASGNKGRGIGLLTSKALPKEQKISP